MGSPSTPNGKGVKRSASGPPSEPRPQGELKENEPSDGEDAEEPEQVSPPVPSLKMLAAAGNKFP